eukprot:3175506-Amphidinium_carterae.1
MAANQSQFPGAGTPTTQTKTGEKRIFLKTFSQSAGGPGTVTVPLQRIQWAGSPSHTVYPQS